ncbi:MAG TPA: RidA family protein [Candidatus Acidoferrum sp.]
MKRWLFLAVWLIVCVASVSAQSQPVEPPPASSSTDAAGSPGIAADGYVYVSGQDSRGARGVPAKFTDQVRQSLDNIKFVVEAAGLNMDHVVYVQVFLEDTKHYDELNQAFATYFSKDPPARSVVGVARLSKPGVEISAIAVRDLNGKHAVAVPDSKPSKAYSLGMLTHDRLFISSMFGRDPATGKIPQDHAEQVNLALDGLKSVTEAAGLTLANMVFVNPYMTSEIHYEEMNKQYAKRFEFGNTPARATIEVASLPDGAQISYTGIAVRDLSQRHSIRPKNMPPSPTASPCVFAGDTLFCSAKSGFIPGPNGGVFAASTADQTRQSMRNQLDNLEEADMSFADVISTTIYLDDLSDWPQFAGVYKKYFSGALPARTTVQQTMPGRRKANKEGEYSDLEQFSLIAVRSRAGSR